MVFYVYILSDNSNSKFIVGFTNNLVRQIHEMKHMQHGFFEKQRINKLVYYESHKEYNDAKRRERELIAWDDNYTRMIVSIQNGKFEDFYTKIFNDPKKQNH